MAAPIEILDCHHHVGDVRSFMPLTGDDDAPGAAVTAEQEARLAIMDAGGVAQATRRQVIVVDASKPSPRLGTRCHVPVEVIRFAWRAEREHLQALGAQVVLRSVGADPFLTDEGNWILDADFGPIDDVPRLAALLQARAGIVEHGLFVGLTHDLLIAGPDGVEHRTL